MDVAMFGTVLLILLIIMCWRTRGTIFPALIALMLGVTLASGSGPVASSAESIVAGVRTGIGSLSQTLFSNRGT
jgi:hypothetical protein